MSKISDDMTDRIREIREVSRMQMWDLTQPQINLLESLLLLVGDLNSELQAHAGDDYDDEYYWEFWKLFQLLMMAAGWDTKREQYATTKQRDEAVAEAEEKFRTETKEEV